MIPKQLGECHGQRTTTASKPGRGTGLVRPRPGQRIPDHQPGSSRQRYRPLAESRRARAHVAAGSPPAREDHAFRPRADSGARGPCPRGWRPRLLHQLRQRLRAVPGRFPQAREADPGLRAVLHRGRFPRLDGHGPRHPRLCHQVLYRRGHFRPCGQQHPGVLHPGWHQVPGSGPCREAAPGCGDPAGAIGPRYLLGFRLPAYPCPSPRDVADERPGDTPLAAHDGRLRRAHLPHGQRGGQSVPGEVPLEAQARRALAGLGRVPAGRRRGSGLPPPRSG